MNADLGGLSVTERAADRASTRVGARVGGHGTPTQAEPPDFAVRSGVLPAATGVPDWAFSVLGPLQIICDEVPRSLPEKRPRVLLALLLAHPGEPLSTERLAEALWDGRPPPSAESALRVHLSKVRAVVGDLLIKRDGGYLLDPERYVLDVNRFDELVTAATSDPAHSPELLTHALALWHGEPLGDLSANDVLARWQRQLQLQRLHALSRQIDARSERGAALELVPELEGLLDDDPYDERLWEHLMLALYRGGRQAEALECFHRARLALAELGIEPGEGLRRLQQRILEQDPALRPPARSPESAPVGSPPAERCLALPSPLGPLIGRASALAELAELCARPYSRLITLCGQGGVGKTRLAIEHARGWAGSFEHGAVFVSLADAGEPGQVRPLIAATLARHRGSSGPVDADLSRYLAERQLLLVLDNFEHVRDAAPMVAELLTEAPRLCVITTSRVALRVRGERVYAVEPLEVASGEDLSGGPAVDLFIDRASAADPRFPATPAVRSRVATICRALDGLPLAIELASARAGQLSLEEIEAQLTQPLTLGAGALVDLPDRHRSVAATLAWSYGRLAPAAQRALRACACLQGAFAAEALTAVCGVPAGDGLDALLDAHLLRRDSDSDRYRLLELVRAYATELSAADPAEDTQFRAAHREHYLERYRWAAEAHAMGSPGKVARQTALDRPNLLSAAEHAINAADSDAARDLLFILESLWEVASVVSTEALPLIEAALAACTFAPKDELWLMRIGLQVQIRASEDSAAGCRRYADRARELDMEYEATDATMVMITEALGRRDLAAAQAHRDALLSLPDFAEDKPRGRSARMFYLSEVAFAEGDYASAARFAEQMLDPVREGPHAHSRTNVWMWLVITRSTRDGMIRLSDLMTSLTSARELEIVDVGVIAVWNAARYVAALEPGLARDWLAGAERIAAEHEIYPWPEDTLRVEALTMLGIEHPAALVDPSPERTVLDLLDVAIAWLEARDPAESVSRDVTARV